VCADGTDVAQIGSQPPVHFVSMARAATVLGCGRSTPFWRPAPRASRPALGARCPGDGSARASARHPGRRRAQPPESHVLATVTLHQCAQAAGPDGFQSSDLHKRREWENVLEL